MGGLTGRRPVGLAALWADSYPNPLQAKSNIAEYNAVRVSARPAPLAFAANGFYRSRLFALEMSTAALFVLVPSLSHRLDGLPSNNRGVAERALAERNAVWV